MSKVEKFFASQKEKFNAHMKGVEAHLAKKQLHYENSLNEFIKNANASMKKTDDKFSGMYNYLVRQFLSNLENRVYSAEVANKTLLMMLADKLYTFEAAKGGEILSKEDFMKALEEEYIKLSTQVHNANEAAAAAQEEVKNEEVTQVVEEPVQTEEAPADQAQQ